MDEELKERLDEIKAIAEEARDNSDTGLWHFLVILLLVAIALKVNAC